MADAELEDTARIARDLIRFETVNWGGGKSNGETDAAEYIAAELTRLGLSPQLFESEPGRTSMVARVEGADPSEDTELESGVPARAVERLKRAVPLLGLDIDGDERSDWPRNGALQGVEGIGECGAWLCTYVVEHAGGELLDSDPFHVAEPALPMRGAQIEHESPHVADLLAGVGRRDRRHAWFRDRVGRGGRASGENGSGGEDWEPAESSQPHPPIMSR